MKDDDDDKRDAYGKFIRKKMKDIIKKSGSESWHSGNKIKHDDDSVIHETGGDE